MKEARFDIFESARDEVIASCMDDTSLFPMISRVVPHSVDLPEVQDYLDKGLLEDSPGISRFRSADTLSAWFKREIETVLLRDRAILCAILLYKNHHERVKNAIASLCSRSLEDLRITDEDNKRSLAQATTTFKPRLLAVSTESIFYPLCLISAADGKKIVDLDFVIDEIGVLFSSQAAATLHSNAGLICPSARIQCYVCTACGNNMEPYNWEELVRLSAIP